MKHLEKDIRENIRRLRKEKGLTLKEMANSCECSAGLLSQIETGAVNPSLATLMSIANTLGITVGKLFSENSAVEGVSPCLVESEERKTFTIQGGIRFQLLTRGIDVPFEFILSRWPPQTFDGNEPHSHEGSECVLLIEGELHMEIDGIDYHMKPGDTITFHSVLPHKTSNPGKKEAVAIWVDSVPWVFSTK